MELVTVGHHIIYVSLSAAITIWVGNTLFKNGHIFLLDAFQDNEAMADAVNHLLLVGFYLVNFAIVSLFLTFGSGPEDIVEFIELMSVKIGIVLLILGFMHFFNMFNIARIRRKGLRKRSEKTPEQPQPTEAIA
ncbi:MAG: hypothetical protein AAF629_28325 [Chloroflexota bacterium]